MNDEFDPDLYKKGSEFLPEDEMPFAEGQHDFFINFLKEVSMYMTTDPFHRLITVVVHCVFRLHLDLKLSITIFLIVSPRTILRTQKKGFRRSLKFA